MGDKAHEVFRASCSGLSQLALRPIPRPALIADLGTAFDTAARLGATEISNSYGGSEYAGETGADSSGDGGYGVEHPAASPYVTAAGGTTLDYSNGTYTQTAWSGAGSG